MKFNCLHNSLRLSGIQDLVIHIGNNSRFRGGSVIKNLPAMQEMQEAQVLSLSQEDPPEAQQLTPVFLPGESHGQRAGWAVVYRITKSQT